VVLKLLTSTLVSFKWPYKSKLWFNLPTSTLLNLHWCYMLWFWPIIATNRLISFQWTKLFKFKGIFLSVCIYSRSDTSMCVSNDSNLSPNSLPSGNCCLPAFSTVQASTLESVTPNHETYLASRRLAVSSSCDGITPVRDLRRTILKQLLLRSTTRVKQALSIILNCGHTQGQEHAWDLQGVTMAHLLFHV